MANGFRPSDSGNLTPLLLQMLLQQRQQSQVSQQRDQEKIESLSSSLVEQGASPREAEDALIGFGATPDMIRRTKALIGVRGRIQKRQEQEGQRQSEVSTLIGQAPQIGQQLESSDPSVAQEAGSQIGRIQSRLGQLGAPELISQLQELIGQSRRSTKAGTAAEREVRVRELRDQRFAESSSLRGEFSDLSADNGKVLGFFNDLQVGAEAATPAGDLSVIFSFMKMLDPNSAVREGEQATAASAGPKVPESIIELYNITLGGERLKASQRRDFLERGRAIASRTAKEQISLEKQFKSIARKNNLDDEQVIIDFLGDNRPKNSNRPPLRESGGTLRKVFEPVNQSAAEREFNKFMKQNPDATALEANKHLRSKGLIR